MSQQLARPRDAMALQRRRRQVCGEDSPGEGEEAEPWQLALEDSGVCVLKDFVKYKNNHHTS